MFSNSIKNLSLTLLNDNPNFTLQSAHYVKRYKTEEVLITKKFFSVQVQIYRLTFLKVWASLEINYETIYFQFIEKTKREASKKIMG